MLLLLTCCPTLSLYCLLLPFFRAAIVVALYHPNILFFSDTSSSFSILQSHSHTELSTGELTTTSKFLLDESLRRSLPNVLKQINPSLSGLPNIMHDIKHSHHDGCFTEEEHQILLSGSVMVQTATGKIFTSQDDRCDVDVFVCRHNAAKLRKALTEHGFVCSNLFAPYTYTPRQALHMFELQGINHVEQYIIKDDTIATITADERLNRELQGFQEDEDFMIHPDGAILDDLLRSGEMPHGFLFVTHPGTLPVVDVIVSNEDSSPQQIIDAFDITACKGTYNGDEFYIPDSSRTFMNTSTSNLWTQLSNAYFAKLMTDNLPDSFCPPNDRGVGPPCNLNDPQDSVHRRHVFHTCLSK